jgi:hypothetical protein
MMDHDGGLALLHADIEDGEFDINSQQYYARLIHHHIYAVLWY